MGSISKMQQLAQMGQSLWLDYIDRPLLQTGRLASLVKAGLRGMTSNPTIFNAAIGASADYDGDIRALKASGKTTFEIYDALTIRDIQNAADHFCGVYETTGGLDGYVSLEINPQLAHHSQEQIQEGLRLHKKVDRPNIMIKVPSTQAGLTVIEALSAAGVSVNATLIFSVRQHADVVSAYFRGLARRAAERQDLSGIRSVASVFVSRIDSVVDSLIDDRLAGNTDQAKGRQLGALRGKAAVANARAIFEQWKSIHDGQAFQGLSAAGANIQRVLWASTGTKDPAYSDIKYVTELICAPTVNTLPEKTLNAFLDHGQVQASFKEGPQVSTGIIRSLRAFGIDIDEVCRDLLVKGVRSFDDAFKELFASIEEKAAKLSALR